LAEQPGQGKAPKQIPISQIATQQGIDLNIVLQLAELTQRTEASRSLWRLRDITTYTLLAIFSLGTLSTVSLFFLNGLGITSLTDVAMGSLAAATIAEVAGLLVIMVKGLFSGVVE
jgi:hypothetical protein